MRKGMPSKRAGRKFSDKEHLHVGVRMYPSEWDRVKYLSSTSGKSTSIYVISVLLAYEGIPKKRQKQEGVFTKNIPLCIPYRDQWDIVKAKAKDAGMSISCYVASVLAEQ